MSESGASSGVKTKPQLENYYRWVEPDSDITVCLKLDMVERLQLAVLRSIDSGSHSGNEVGGILLGRTELDEGRTFTFVDDFEPVPCEHRRGPAYDLSPKEAINFETVLNRMGARKPLSAVGYFRSHNRDGLFLSADDLKLIQRHFRQPDNLFLLIKTLPKNACTAGFFFWKNGQLQSEFTDSEAPLIPISIFSGNDNLPLGQAIDEIPSEAPAAVSAESGTNRDLKRRLVPGLVVAGVAVAATVAVMWYREAGPASNPTPAVQRPVPAATANVTPPPPTPVPAPAGGQPATLIPSAPKPVLSQPRNNPATPLSHESKQPAPTPAPAPETPPVRPTVASEPVAPPISKPSTAAAEQPLNTAQPASAETKIAPAVPVTSPPVLESPAKPAAEVPRPNVVPPESTPAPAPTPGTASQEAHTYVAPQVIHQAVPAVPRSVETMITTDVQVDVAVSIDAKGKVTGARVSSTKGAAAGLLTIEALKAAQLFRFRPAQENGHNVAGNMVITFRFARTAK